MSKMVVLPDPVGAKVSTSSWSLCVCTYRRLPGFPCSCKPVDQYERPIQGIVTTHHGVNLTLHRVEQGELKDGAIHLGCP